MLPTIELKPLTTSDAEKLSVLATRAYLDHYAETWHDNGAWYVQTYFSVTQLQEELRDKKVQFFAVHEQQQTVGFIKLNLDRPSPCGERNALELERIYLLKSAGGKGIGTVAMQAIFEIGERFNKICIWLKAMDTSTDAVCFYQKMGFEICGTHQVDFVQKKDGMRGMYVMQKKLWRGV